MKNFKGNYQIVFDDYCGDILSYKSPKGKEYISSWGKLPLITMKVIDNAGKREEINSGFNCQLKVDKTEDSYIFNFAKFGGFDIKVKATVRFLEDRIEWTLSLVNNSEYLIEWIDYPTMLLEQMMVYRGLDHKMFLPFLEGVEISDYTLRKKYYKYLDMDYPSKGWEGTYPGAVPIQCMGYYSDTDGLYFGMHDTEFNLKQIDMDETWNGIRTVLKVMTGTEDKKFDYNFNVVTKFIDGGFYDCAEEYRNFVESSNMTKQPKILENKNIPTWIDDSPIVIALTVRGEKDTGEVKPTMYYPYENILKYTEELGKRLNSRLLVMIMQWEGTAPWCSPFIWPPYGDLESFKKLEKGIHEQGHLFGLYCSGTSWTEKSIFTDYNNEGYFTEEEKKEVMCLAPDQSLPYCVICNDYIRWGYDMCPSTPKMKELMMNDLMGMVNGVNVDYIQLFDQNLGGGPSLCYAKNHGHPRLPGKWEVKAMRDLILEMQGEIKKAGKETILGAEAQSADAYNDLLVLNDGRNYQGFFIGNCVPIYNYVYHEYITNYMGNQVGGHILDHLKNRDNIFYRTAYCFSKGDLITFILKGDGKPNWSWCLEWDVEDVPEDYEPFSEYLNNLRKGEFKDPLKYGKMQRPLKVEDGEYVLTFKAGEKNKLSSMITSRYTYNGSDVQMLINSLSYDQTVKVYTEGKQVEVKLDGEIVSKGKDYIEIKIPKRKVAMLVIK